MNNLVNMENSRSCLQYTSKVNYTLTVLSAIVVFLVCMLVTTTSAGDCWAQRSSGFNACKALLKKNVTKDHCCKYSGKGISWTEESYSYSDIFKLTNLQNGVPNCQPCRGESGHDSCDQIDCGNDKKCVMKKGKPRCVCSPDCSNTDDEPRGDVCATDGRSYKTKCAMLKERCREGKDMLKMAYFGTCKRSCDGVVCPDKNRCVEDQFGLPHCVSCYSYCPQSVQGLFVCGEDGVTYESLCQLKRTECIQRRKIGMAHHGKCENLTTCDDMSCVEKKACVMDDDEPRCVVCDFLCYGWRERGPICASDGKTYNNWCHLQEYICNTTQYLTIEGLGICGDGELYEVPEEGSGFITEDDNSILWRFLVGGGGGPIYEDADEDVPDIDSEDIISENNSTIGAENSTVSSTEPNTPVNSTLTPTFENASGAKTKND